MRVSSVALAKEDTLRRVPPDEACVEVCHGRKPVGLHKKCGETTNVPALKGYDTTPDFLSAHQDLNLSRNSVSVSELELARSRHCFNHLMS